MLSVYVSVRSVAVTDALSQLQCAGMFAPPLTCHATATLYPTTINLKPAPISMHVTHTTLSPHTPAKHTNRPLLQDAAAHPGGLDLSAQQAALLVFSTQVVGECVCDNEAECVGTEGGQGAAAAGVAVRVCVCLLFAHEVCGRWRESGACIRLCVRAC